MSGTLWGFLVRRHRLSIGLCLLVPVAIGIVVGLLYPTYAEARNLLQVFKFSTRFFGGEDMDLFSPTGSFTLPFQHPLCLIALAVLGGIAALGLPAGERGRGGLDLLLASPLSRGRMMGTLSVFSFAVAALVGAMGEIGALLGAAIADASDAVPPLRYLVVAALSAALCACLSGVALLISTLSRDRGQATLVYGVAVFVLFVLDVVARLWLAGAWIGRLTPYGYLRPSRALGEGGLATALVDGAILLAATLMLHVLAWRIAVHRRRV